MTTRNKREATDWMNSQKDRNFYDIQRHNQIIWRGICVHFMQIKNKDVAIIILLDYLLCRHKKRRRRKELQI